MAKPLLGFSSGCMHKTHSSLDPEVFEFYRSLNSPAAEIMFHNVTDIDEFSKLKAETIASFDYVSLHAPIYRPAEHQAYLKVLEAIQAKHQEIHFDTIVLHPETFPNFDLLKKFNLPFAVENMDNRKPSCKNVTDMQKVFTQFNVPMVLDLNHCFSNDPSMQLAKEMVSAFKERICQIHLSGFTTFHDPLFQTKQTQILDSLFDLSIPIIIESELDTFDDVKAEYKYILNYITENPQHHT